MRATFIGTSDGYTSRRDHSGILLETPETTLLLDCGGAAARFLLKKKYPPAAPEILWLSHMHSDHNGQVSSLVQSLWLRGRREPLHIFGPSGVLKAMKEWLPRCLLFPELIGFPIRWHPVRAGVPYTHGLVTLTAFPTEHLKGLAQAFKKSYPATCFDCFGLVLEYGERRYVYSADLAHPRELLPAMGKKEVAALICELTHFPERELFQILSNSSVESLWLTHYPDKTVRRKTELQRMAQEERFKGGVHLVEDGVAQEI